jgi:peptidoglycan/xylan/chitin deacetylase (PgdA/CDA1 family)
VSADRRSLIALAACLCLAAGGCGGGAGKNVAHHHAHATAPAHRPAAPAVRPSAANAVKRLLATGRPVYCGGRLPYAALTFDDGPGPYTPLALRILHHARVPATFFLVGRNVGPYASFARREKSAGDALENHSFTHPLLTQLPAPAVQSELESTSAAISRTAGAAPSLFRPPYEAHNASVDQIAHRLGLLEILWSLDSRDALGANYAGIARIVSRQLGPGTIVLMHENRGQTIRALKFYILPALKRRHIRLVTVPELLALDPPSPAQLQAGLRGCRSPA